jgi:hypothetical protein
MFPPLGAWIRLGVFVILGTCIGVGVFANILGTGIGTGVFTNILGTGIGTGVLLGTWARVGGVANMEGVSNPSPFPVPSLSRSSSSPPAATALGPVGVSSLASAENKGGEYTHSSELTYSEELWRWPPWARGSRCRDVFSCCRLVLPPDRVKRWGKDEARSLIFALCGDRFSKRVQLQGIVYGAPGARLGKGLEVSGEARGTFLLQHHRQPYAYCNRHLRVLGLRGTGGCAAVLSQANNILNGARGSGCHYVGFAGLWVLP